MGSVVRRRSATQRERPSPATTAERWRLLEAIERSRSAGWAGVSGGGRNATLGSVAREPQRERRRASRWIGNTYLDDSGRDSPASLNSTGDM